MQYSTQTKTYGSPQDTLVSGSSTGNSTTTNNVNKQIQSNTTYRIVDKK